MRVDPEYAGVGEFFVNNPMFRVPKYQRSYAWEDEEIRDYLKDLEECYLKRSEGNPINHFFGGIVSVEQRVSGVLRQSQYEMVDGQQRFATFVITIAVAIDIYQNSLLNEATANSDSSNIDIITRRIENLTGRFIEFEQEVNRNTQVVESLILSKADNDFFKNIIRGNNPTVERDSHGRIEQAYSKIKDKIEELIDDSTLENKMDKLETFKIIIDEDFSILNIVTHSNKEAYKLFQVLNDRGKSLTEGDLLRAKTLELLEGKRTQQDSTESLWDKIMIDPPKTIETYLRWIYASSHGGRPGRSSLFDDFLTKFYPDNNATTITSAAATRIKSATDLIHKEFIVCRKISEGNWPFPDSRAPITGWDRNRLSLLIKELGLIVTIPILLAAYKLGEKKFSEIVQILEIFLFRYKVVSNQHIEAAVSIIHAQSVLIRSGTTTYNPNTLRLALRSLMTSRAGDDNFKNNLESLSYREGGGNKPIKYFLMTLEHYKRWYDEGATGKPTCRDKTRIYDFSSTTIEHIYPRNVQAVDLDSSIDSRKNELENLTFMGPTDNVVGGNDNFSTKKPIFEASSVQLNIDIGANLNWSLTELKQLACKIYTI
jgi:hypothetical protein